jgi:hypothetical protein
MKMMTYSEIKFSKNIQISRKNSKFRKNLELEFGGLLPEMKSIIDNDEKHENC